MVTITVFGENKCIWCCQVSGGVQAKFQDGLSGFLCKKHFWQAMQVRTASGETPPTTPVAENQSSGKR